MTMTMTRYVLITRLTPSLLNEDIYKRTSHLSLHDEQCGGEMGSWVVADFVGVVHRRRSSGWLDLLGEID
jgi:hypothetical protein